MSSKRSKKVKLELVTSTPNEKNNSKQKKNKDLLLNEQQNKLDDFNIENNVVINNKKRKKNDIDTNPTKKIKKEPVLIKLENHDDTRNVSNCSKTSISNFEDEDKNDDENEIEHKHTIETNQAELTWPDEDITELLQRMEQNIPEKDTLAYGTRVEKLDWSNVAFNDYTIDECKKTWMLVQKHVRRYRLLGEVLADAKEWVNTPKVKKARKKPKHPDMPKKPYSAYLLYYLEKRMEVSEENPGIKRPDKAKLVSQMYRNLPTEEKQKYEKIAAILKEDYERKMKKFLDSHPDYVKPEKPEKEKVEKEKPPKPDKPPNKPQTPFSLFYHAELGTAPEDMDRNVFKEKCKEQWKEMNDKKKLVWITLAEEGEAKYNENVKSYQGTHPEFVPNTKLKPVITKEEKLLKERVAGKPVKPPNSAYGLYSRGLMKSEDIKQISPRERMNFIANKWKNCSETEKNSYRVMALRLMDKYKSEYAAYLNTLPEEQRELEIQSIKKSKAVTPEKKPVTPDKKTATIDKKPVTLDKKPVIPDKKLVTSEKKPVTTEKKPSPVKAPTVKRKKLANRKPPLQDKIFKLEPEQPPVTPSKYFAKVYIGDGDPKKLWKSLSLNVKQMYMDDLVKKKKAYIIEYEKFLNSLSREELEAYSKSRQQRDDDESSECSSDSDYDNDIEDNESFDQEQYIF